MGHQTQKIDIGSTHYTIKLNLLIQECLLPFFTQLWSCTHFDKGSVTLSIYISCILNTYNLVITDKFFMGYVKFKYYFHSSFFKMPKKKNYQGYTSNDYPDHGDTPSHGPR